MVEYNNVHVNLSDSQLNKLKTTVKYRQGLTLRMHVKLFDRNNLPHELLLTTRQETKLTNAFKNKMSTDTELRKAKISKINQSGGIFRSIIA